MQLIRLAACVVVTAYAALAVLLMGEAAVAVEVIMWAVAPLALLLAVVLIARRPRTWAFAILLFIAVTGATGLTWGLRWNPGDYNHLVIVFLPIHQFSLIALAFAAFAVVGLCKRLWPSST